MKLSTRVRLSVLMVILLPLLLGTIFIFLITYLQTEEFSNKYEVENVFTMNHLLPLQLLNKMTNSIYEDMKQCAIEYPDRFNNYEYLDSWAERLSSRYSSLIVRKNQDILYTNAHIEDVRIKSLLSDYIGDMDSSEFDVFYGDEYQYIIKQLDFTDTEDNKFSMFIITSAKQMVPQVNVIMIETIVAMIFIMSFTSFCMMLWMNHSIVKPLTDLQDATQKIKEGNLDFKLEYKNTGDEIDMLTKDFEEMRIILKESAEYKLKTEKEEKELISNISHDLKTPITTIKGYVEGLLDGVADTPEKRNRYLRTIASRAVDMDRLIDELTTYSRIDLNRVPYTFKKINLNDYMKDCGDELKLELETRNMYLEYNNYSNEDIYILIDPEQIKRVIMNIVSNSIKYKKEGTGFIKISVFNENTEVLIRIEDNGKGIEKEALKHIFERFYRADSSRNSKQGGSGIGLAIVKKIIEDHNGTITASSELGVGTTINIRLKKEI